MKRYLCCLSLLGVVAVPDWASAFHPCWCPPPYASYGPPPYASYGPPRFYYPRPFAIFPRRVPAFVAPPAPIAVYPTMVAPLVYAVPTTPVYVAPPVIPQSIARPTPAPASPAVMTDPMVRPAGGTTAEPTPRPVLPPPSVVTAPNDKKNAEPPETVKPKSPEPAVPEAKPTPAPPPSEVGPLISPPMVPTLPGTLEPKKVTGANDSLPPLVLPPEAPGGSTGIVPESTSRSSPLSAGFKVQVFAASGALRAAATRRIGFFNHTDRDIDLVIEGKAVTLPGKTYIHAEVPPTFTWRHSENPGQRTSVPADAAGLDILFRE